MRKESLAVSLAIHIAVIGSLLLLRIPQSYVTRPPALLSPSPLLKATRLAMPPPPRRAVQSSAPAGGGSRSLTPPSRGVVPSLPRETRVFLPPQIEVPERAKLVVPMGIEEVPKLQGVVGDPNGKGAVPSLGFGTNGVGGPGSYGPGNGPGGPTDGDGGSGKVASLGRPSKWPELLSKIEPEYSEPARKARHQGTVLLAVDIGSDGRPRNIRVVRGIGMGLDEKAMEAVSTWRFRPALLHGRPVAAPITVEVNFRLL
jgi:periplasmic protein TonB